jgi:2-succinyl-5-enolpyruvyl-6-hydroxy-3-cyclohexene-1-carboxylate synthase
MDLESTVKLAWARFVQYYRSKKHLLVLGSRAVNSLSAEANYWSCVNEAIHVGKDQSRVASIVIRHNLLQDIFELGEEDLNAQYVVRLGHMSLSLQTG